MVVPKNKTRVETNTTLDHVRAAVSTVINMPVFICFNDKDILSTIAEGVGVPDDKIPQIGCLSHRKSLFRSRPTIDQGPFKIALFICF